ncbi:MAG: ATP-grasp domain-containing protein [Saprospiraceae bacterium]|nr:ATP-grasp domain-containing protein [Saprospiraceae bacterium]
MIKHILIANRGEIACRIIKTCRRLGIWTTAIYADPDVGAMHCELADEAVALGGIELKDTYLNQDKILDIAQQVGADAIHPGYGFLSENAAFAKNCADRGLIFIGPSPEAIHKMGLKSEAKLLMQAHNVPVITGYQGSMQDLGQLKEEASKIGYPILLKAVAGGGGKGMRIVEKEEELEQALLAAKREAANSFGNDTLIMERYFASARHIEFQIFGDQHGNILHLFERECSIQRRHQKVIEESPSSALDEATRQAMGAAAVRAAKALDYVNAGTVEFIYTDEGEYYFLEINTRLQVEHPVTEMVTGLDLVEWQILVAEGEALPLKQEELKQNGYALECRLYAEDPTNSYFPVTGTVVHWDAPELEAVRYDTGVRTGTEISVHYDPMIAKLIAHGKNRATAIRRMSYALQQLKCLGLKHNQAFLQAVLNDPRFLKGAYNTRFLQEEFDLEQLNHVDAGHQDIALVMLSLWSWAQRESKRDLLPNLPSAWRNNWYKAQETYYTLGTEVIGLAYNSTSQGRFEYHIREVSYQVDLIGINDGTEIEIKVNNRHYKGSIVQNQISRAYYVYSPSWGQLEILENERFPEVSTEEGDAAYESPMPSKVLEILVAKGQKVKKGDPLLVLLSMKMENTILANSDGTIQEIYVENGELIEAGVLLLDLE